MKYIEFINFEKVLPQVELRLFQKLNHFRRSGMACVVWQKGNTRHPAKPNLSIIYAPRLSESAIEFLIQRINSDIPVIYGAMRSVSGALLINSFSDLEEIICNLK